MNIFFTMNALREYVPFRCWRPKLRDWGERWMDILTQPDPLKTRVNSLTFG